MFKSIVGVKFKIKCYFYFFKNKIFFVFKVEIVWKLFKNVKEHEIPEHNLTWIIIIQIYLMLNDVIYGHM